MDGSNILEQKISRLHLAVLPFLELLFAASAVLQRVPVALNLPEV
jgi:hypothetical protein